MTTFTWIAHTHPHHSLCPHHLCQRPHWTMTTDRQTTPECRQCWHRLQRSNGQAHRRVHANTHADPQTHKQTARSNLIQWHRSSLSVQLTALSPRGRAPLSSQHSFRYLAETFSLCLPFSKTCFMLGAPPAVVLQSAISYLPLSGSLSHSSSLARSPCPHSSPELPSCLSLTLTPSPRPIPPLFMHSNFHERSQPWTEDILRHAP